MKLPIYICESLLSQHSNSIQCFSPISRLPRETIGFYAEIDLSKSQYIPCLYCVVVFSGYLRANDTQNKGDNTVSCGALNAASSFTQSFTLLALTSSSQLNANEVRPLNESLWSTLSIRIG